MESGGVDVGVTDDIDGDARPAVPDIGADEISVSGPGILQFSSTNYTANEGTTATINVIRGAGLDGTVGVTATITDGTATGGAACTAGIDYINPGPQMLSFNMGEALKSFNIDTCSDATLKSNETVILTLSNPTGGATIGANNPATLTIVDVPPPFSGTINVGTGETFTSLTNPGGIFAAINGAGLSANLTVNITSDLTAETGAVQLNQFTETGAGNYTLTFKPSGAARVISGTSATSNGLINLNGVDRVTFDGSLSGGTDRSLTITNNQATSGLVFWIKSGGVGNGANNNTIKNCIINGAPGPNSTTIAGILAGNSTTLGNPAEAANNNNTIQNNRIFRVQNSMFISGASSPVFDQNWMIINNELGSAETNDNNIFRGMLLGSAQNFTISGNRVQGIRSTTTTGVAMSGIQLAFLVNGGTITNNVISNIKNISASGTGAYGINFTTTSTASNVTVANNFIYDVAANGSATLASNGYGINVASGAGYNVYFNSINMNTDQTSGTSAAMLVQAAVTTAGGLNVRNNIFANTQTGGATRYSFYSGAAATVYSAINYNNYFSSQNVGFLGGVRATLPEWQTATGQDTNSLAVNPLFVSATDLHLQAASPMINAGTPITGITTDIDGDIRSATTPDIGADEFVMVANPGSLQFSSATYSVNEGAGSITLTVTRTGGSSGTVGVTYSLGGGTATGGAACTAGVDYINTGGTLSFADGETSKTFNVTICEDTLVEGNETFNATLSNATGGATIGTPNPATVTIVDNDTPSTNYTVAISDARVREGNAGTVNMVFNVTLTAVMPVSNAGGPIASVQYATANGTAIAGSDYTATSGTLNFNAPGTLTISVPVIGDTLKESNEFFFVNLSNPSMNTTITDGQGAGIIVDDDRAYQADFDRDLKSDFSVFRPSELLWYVLRSSDSQVNIGSAGPTSGVPVPGDYDGDGKTDYAIFQASTGTWCILNSSNNLLQKVNWGIAGDKPVQGDYDGDGKTDVAIYRPSTGTWWIIRSSDNTTIVVPFGISTDKPMQGDYDGDFKTDIAVYRDGTWYVMRSSNNSVSISNWGNSTDKPVSGDFDGDGRNDLAIYRNGQWWILNSLSGSSRVITFGLATDIPAPADYDGDGSSDIAVFRPSSGNWFVLNSSNQTITGLNWGVNNDVPIPSAYIPQ
jgi:hypothetical protein